jgi:hypothetical protein
MSEEFRTILIIGAGISLLGAFNLLKCLIRRKWPETIGKVQENEVRQVTSSIFSLLRTGPIGNFASKSYAGTDKEMELRLSYVYAIDGYKYIGNQLYSAPIVKVRSRIGDLHEGTKVKVFYNPKNPAVSFLAHSFAWPSLVVILIGLVTMAAAYVQISQ